MKTYVVRTADATRVVEAESRSAAKYRLFKEAGSGQNFHDFLKTVESVRCMFPFPASVLYGKADEFTRAKALRGLPFAYQGQRVVWRGVGGNVEGIILGADIQMSLAILFKGETTPVSCHPHHNLTYFDEQGSPVATF